MQSSSSHSAGQRGVINLAIVAVFTALALVTNYAMIGLPNVKLMDAIVFIAAFLFGLRVGVGIASLTWLVYGFINPYGSADFVLLAFLIVGECFYAIGGAILSRTPTVRDLMGRRNPKKFPTRTSPSLLTIPIFGLVGFQATFAYDVLTNFASWIFKTNSLYQAFVIGMVTGAPFAIVHEISNIVFFAFVVPIVIIAAKRFELTGIGRY